MPVQGGFAWVRKDTRTGRDIKSGPGRTKASVGCSSGMKILAIILVVLLALFIAFQIYTTVSTARTEQQPYAVVTQRGALEIRHYPVSVLATVEISDTAYQSGSSSGFRRLAGYIFGANVRAEKIAMTAPVRMEKGASGLRMSFVMPGDRDTASLPAPRDPGVRLARSVDEHAAVLRFGGFLSDEVMVDRKQALLDAVGREGLTVTGEVTYLGYDPPWQLVGRRNEVLVPVRWPD